jgi:hypothetical protein
MQKQEVMEKEICSIEHAKELPKNHWLRKCTPFVDEKGILGVGGRLENAVLEYDRKHPIILTKVMRITKLIVNKAHYNKKGIPSLHKMH